MKALRLILHQSSANYKREETVDNKMTYPLPPISTIIGALHNACGYQEYKEMNVSIQGRYESMHREPYTDYCFLNTLQDDRGILVKMRNGNMLSNAFEKVASAKKPQGNSFRNNITIQIHNQQLMQEFRDLKDLNDKINDFKKKRLGPVLELIKKRKKHLAEKKKVLDKQSKEYEQVVSREKELKGYEKIIKQQVEQYQMLNYTIPISKYRSLTKSMKFYEILDNIHLIIHIQAEEEILKELLDHIYNLKSLGRSEDVVTVEEAVIVELYEDTEQDEIINVDAAYLDYEMVKPDVINNNKQRIFLNQRIGHKFSGTKYYLNKKYNIQDGKRIFEKKKVLYASDYAVEEFGDGLYIDRIKGKEYIVNFL